MVKDRRWRRGWSIVLLDLGIVLTATAATAVALLAGRGWARRALYAILGWWAFVPASVAAMGITMIARDDPYASVGQTVVLALRAVAFVGFVVYLYRPLFQPARIEPPAPDDLMEPERKTLTRAR